MALARAAVPRPAILLADEPTGNLDGVNGQAIMDLLFGLRDRHGATLVLVTHAPELAARCDRVIRLADGLLAPEAAAAQGRRMSLALTIARRELRGGLRGFRVFLACLALGVAAIAAVGTLRTGIQQGLTDQGAVILGGDAEMRFTYRPADADERAYMDRIATQVSEVYDFRSMAADRRRPGPDPDQGRRRRLAPDRHRDP